MRSATRTGDAAFNMALGHMVDCAAAADCVAAIWVGVERMQIDPRSPMNFSLQTSHCFVLSLAFMCDLPFTC